MTRVLLYGRDWFITGGLAQAKIGFNDWKEKVAKIIVIVRNAKKCFMVLVPGESWVCPSPRWHLCPRWCRQSGWWYLGCCRNSEDVPRPGFELRDVSAADGGSPVSESSASAVDRQRQRNPARSGSGSSPARRCLADCDRVSVDVWESFQMCRGTRRWTCLECCRRSRPPTPDRRLAKNYFSISDIVANLWGSVSNIKLPSQCDQMARPFFNIWPLQPWKIDQYLP